MQHVLIINLKRLGDVYTTANLVSAFKNQSPNTEVTMLVFDECVGAARNIANVDHVFTISRKEIITLKVNKIFSDGMAIENLFEALKPLKSSQWDRIVNFSNDKISAYIASYLNTNTNGKKIGVNFSADKSISYNSDWDIVYNELVATTENTPFSFVDTLLRMNGVEDETTKSKLVLSRKHTENAEKNITHLKKKFQTDLNTPARVIGIQIFSSHKSKQIAHETLKGVISKLISDSRYIPLILIAPIESERVFAQNLNQELGNQLIIAEADLSALASVLTSIDYLLTPDTVTKHIADLCKTPCLEVSLGNAPLFKQGSKNPESFVITPFAPSRVFSNSENNFLSSDITDQSDVIQVSDILNCIEFFFSGENTNLVPVLSENVTLYRPVSDEVGVRLQAVCGRISGDYESVRLLSRYLIAKSLGTDLNNEIIEYCANTLVKDLPRWMEEQKTFVTSITKDLLSTLRALIQAQESKRKVVEFVTNLDRLLSNTDDRSLVSPFVKIFRGKVEALSGEGFTENIRELEGLLYELKADLQKVLQVLKDVETSWTTKRKDNFKKLSTQNAPSIMPRA